MRPRTAASYALSFVPALIWIAVVVLVLGPRYSYVRALGFAAFTSLAVLGLTALFVAYFPWTMERLGFRRFAAWLRHWWDEDAR